MKPTSPNRRGRKRLKRRFEGKVIESRHCHTDVIKMALKAEAKSLMAGIDEQGLD
jgi:hypothetical protein